MTANHLFAPDSPKLWTIPAGEPFLERLAQGLVDATGLAEKPDALADALIYVPNRRSATSLAKAFHKAVGRGLLLPSIRALGDTDPVEPFTGPAEATAALGPELRDAERLGALAAMVSKRLQPDGDRLPAVSAIAAARELADLLDQAALAGGVDWTRLPDLLADGDLAEHWSKSVEFLKIVSDDWPAWLKSRGALEPFARRIALAEAAAEDWRTAPPSGLVAIAGSTGATPASRTLMAAALNLPRGLVVLPGIDLEADAAVWTRLQEDPGHPQAAFAKTLSTLNARREEIGVWPIAGTTGSARRSLVHESLASVEDTGGWLDRIEALSKPRAVSEFTREALEGFSLIEAGSASDEASLAALLLRETLETTGKTAALITPDPTLSRRVSALLKRWDVHAPSGAGTPVLRSAEGSAIALILNWLKDPADPLSLAALLKHPLADFDDSDTVALEQNWLRGPRRWSDLNDLAEQSNSINVKVLSQARDECGLPELGDGVTGPAASEAMIVLASQVFGGSVWLGPGGRSAQSLLDDLATTTQGLGVIDINDLSALLNVLADGRTLPPHETPHPRLALLSPLEARLQSADRIILAGLNEGVWPAQPAPQAFLPRRFRKALGLDPLEARLGLSAHDFAQSACAPEVWALYSARRDDAPALASRWIWRLKTLARGALGTAGASAALAPPQTRDPCDWLSHLDKGRSLRLAVEPKPRPPVSARPSRLSVTWIDKLQRDPYEIYASKILGLDALDPIGAPIDARGRGTAVHTALERFEKTLDPSADTLLALLEDALRRSGETAENLASERALRRRAVEAFLQWRSDRNTPLSELRLESRGQITLTIDGRDFTLSAQADRIELKDRGIAIVDFKTGRLATDKQISAGLEQQMPLQALIGERGGFGDFEGRKVTELIYVAFKSKFEARALSGDPVELAEAAHEGLVRLITEFNRPDTPYLSQPRAQFVRYASAFDRLARRSEWAEDVADE